MELCVSTEWTGPLWLRGIASDDVFVVPVPEIGKGRYDLSGHELTPSCCFVGEGRWCSRTVSQDDQRWVIDLVERRRLVDVEADVRDLDPAMPFRALSRRRADVVPAVLGRAVACLPFGSPLVLDPSFQIGCWRPKLRRAEWP